MLLQDVDTAFLQDDARTVAHDVDVLVRGGRIVEVDDRVTTGDETIDCSDRILLPGLINCHAHTPGILTRGWSDDESLFDWLDSTGAVLAEADRDLRRAAARLSATRLLETGTTTVNDMWNTYLGETFEAVGIRALLGCGLADEGVDRDDVDERLDAAREFVAAGTDHPRLHPTVPVHSVYRASGDLLESAHDIAAAHDVPFHVHVSETRRENEDCLAEHGLTPTAYLDDLGVLDERGVLAHCVHLTDDDGDLIRERGAGVAHCPAANCKLGSGVADLPALEGVPVGLGTDGAASNNTLDLFREARLAALLQKRTDPEAVTAQGALDMVTRDAARVLGMADVLGSIEVGKRADLVLLDATDPTLRPHYGDAGLLSNIIYSFHGRVETAIVEGEVVVEDGAALADVGDAVEAVGSFCERIGTEFERP
jgi:5-methylthioadenosine/S-adenosylhomocysteine deaminase